MAFWKPIPKRSSRRYPMGIFNTRLQTSQTVGSVIDRSKSLLGELVILKDGTNFESPRERGLLDLII
jgi:hypothetical protein